MQGSALQGARLIFRREVACAMRSRSSWAAMFMFSLTAIAALSFALRCAPPEPQVAAGLLWVVLFFSAEAGVGRAFYEEAASGTLLALRIYAGAQAVFVGKFCYTLFMLTALAVFDLALFQVFLGFSLADFFAAMVFLLVVFLGIWGLAAAGGIVSARARRAGCFRCCCCLSFCPCSCPRSISRESFSAPSCRPLPCSVRWRSTT